jgi:hypothetical protein
VEDIEGKSLIWIFSLGYSVAAWWLRARLFLRLLRGSCQRRIMLAFRNFPLRGWPFAILLEHVTFSCLSSSITQDSKIYLHRYE